MASQSPLIESGGVNAESLLKLLEIRRVSQQSAGTSSDKGGEETFLKDKLRLKEPVADSNAGFESKAVEGEESWSEAEGWEGFEPDGTESKGFKSLRTTESGTLGSRQSQEDEKEGRRDQYVESWLNDHSLATALLQLKKGLNLLAFAKGKKVALALLSNPDSIEPGNKAATRSKNQDHLWPVDSRCEGSESVTALSWLSVSEDSGRDPPTWLCVGSSAGIVRFLRITLESSEVRAAFVLSQRFHRSPVLHLHLRSFSGGLASGDSLQELSVVHSGALVAVQALDLGPGLSMTAPPQHGLEQSPSEKGGPPGGVHEGTRSNKGQETDQAAQIRRRRGQESELLLGAQQQQSPPLEGGPPVSVVRTPELKERKTAHLPFLKWKLAASWNISDAAILGVRPGSLLGGFVEEPVYGVVVAGGKPFVAFYDAPIREETESVLSRASGVATKVGSAVYASASSVLSLGRTLPPRLGSKLFELNAKQKAPTLNGSDTESDGEADPSDSAPTVVDTLATKPLQTIQRAVTLNLGAAAASVNMAAANIVSVGPTELGRQLVAGVSARSASLSSLSTGLGLREKLKASLGMKASRSLETVQSLDSTSNGEDHPTVSGKPEGKSSEETRAEDQLEWERLERMGGVAASLVGSLDDPPRKGLRLTMAPIGSLGALTDNLGRVSLIEGLGGVILRVWKGFRDAQCAWVVRRRQEQVDLCLAIYAPQKGILEIWPVPYGPKLATCDCGYGCRLLQGSPEIKTRTSEDRGWQPKLLTTACLLCADGSFFELKP